LRSWKWRVHYKVVFFRKEGGDIRAPCSSLCNENYSYL
jgi:hypothetical protein